MARHLLFTFVFALALAACGDDSSPAAADETPAGNPSANLLIAPAEPQAADGAAAYALELELLDGKGLPMAGVAVELEVGGSGNLIEAPAPTDAAGRTAASVASTVAGTKPVQFFALIDGARLPVGGASYIEFLPTAAAGLAFERVPAAVQAGSTFQVRVVTRDAGGAPAREAIAITLEAEGATLVGTTRITTDAYGVAHFSSLRLDEAQASVALVASASGMAPIRATIAVLAGGGAQISWNSQPVDAIAGETLPALELVVRDAVGNLVAAPTRVVLALADGATGLAGTTATTTSGGIARFDDVRVNETGVELRLVATVAGVDGVASDSFSVTPAEPDADASSIGIQPEQIEVGEEAAIVVSIRDAFGNAVPGVELGVTASGDENEFDPAAGIVTDEQGEARIALRSTRAEVKEITITAGALVLRAIVEFVPAAASPADVVVVGGEQVALAGSVLPEPVGLIVRDAFGNGVPGVAVTFVAAHGTIDPGAGITDATGAVSTVWQLGTTAGTQQLVAEVAGWDTTVAIDATALPGDATALQLVGGDAQQGPVAQALPLPLQVLALDAWGNPVPAASVSFSAVLGGGSLAPAVATTDAAGLASATFTLGSGVGAQAAEAVVGTSTVRFDAVALVGAAQVLMAEAGSGQTGTVGTTLPLPLVARVEDAHGNAIAGAPVTFHALDGGTIVPTGPSTDSAGRIEASFRLGTAAGTQRVEARLAGLTAASFVLAAEAGPAFAIAASSGNGQTGVVDSLAGLPLVAQVTDAYGNPVGNVTVTFSSTTARLTPAVVATGATGSAQTQLRHPEQSGPFTVSASAAGVTTPAIFTGTATHGAPAQITAVAAVTVQPLQSLPFTVAVKDAFGNVVPNLPVTFWVTSGSGHVSPSAITNASGQATAQLVGGPSAGNLAVRVTAGATVSTLDATVVPGPAADLQAHAGDGQTGSLGAALAVPFTVRLVDAHGNPIAGHAIAFSVVTGGATLALAGATTDASGIASTIVTPTQRGPLVVLATAASLSITFDALIDPATIETVIGGETQLLAGSNGPPLVVRLLDDSSAPIANAPVDFTVTSGNATVVTVFGTTNADGYAQAVVGAAAGAATVTASSLGASTTFALDTFSPTKPLACQAHAGRLRTFTGVGVTHYREGVYRLYADGPDWTGTAGPISFEAQVRFGAPPAGLPTALSVVNGVAMRGENPTTRVRSDLVIDGTGTLRVDGIELLMSPGASWLNHVYRVHRLQDGRWHVEFSPGPWTDHLWITVADGMISSVIADVDWTPGEGVFNGLCGLNDGSDDSMNFNLEAARTGADSLFP